MGGVSAAGAIEDFVSIGDHGGKAVLGLVYMEIQDFARFTGAIGIFAVDIAYVILVDQAFAIGIDEGGNAYILRLKIEDSVINTPSSEPNSEKAIRYCADSQLFFIRTKVACMLHSPIMS